MQCKGRVVVTGIGKYSHIGNKIALTLAGTSTPLFFVQAGEVRHGDLGMSFDRDVVISHFNSGKIDEPDPSNY